MEPTYEDIQELRTRFAQKVQEENKDFHPKDQARVNTDDNWLKRFLVHHESDKEEALKMMLETCEWRRTNKVNEMAENSLNRESLVSGNLFLHNKDRDGKPLLIFKCARHVKGQKNMEDLKKVVIYWFERAERTGNDQVTIFFDMLGTGLSNMDMEYIKYLITICKLYYPNFLNYILIFEMPWVLNAAFKIIKSWLPAKAVQKIKFVARSNLKEFVDPSQALVSWGGTDSYEFVFVSDFGSGEYTKSEDSKKKVHFAKDQMYESVDSPTVNDVSARDASSFESASVKVTPSDAIPFVQEGIEMSGSLTITNISERPVTFKVKTTKPEKFRVRPYCGSIGVGSSVSITVVLLSGFNVSSIAQDKFLVLTLPLDTDNPTTNQINDSWKSADSEKIEEFKLRCRVSSSPNQQIVQANGAVGLATSTGDLEQKVSQLLLSMNHVSEICSGVEAELKTWRRLATVFIVAFFGLAVFFFYASYPPSECVPDHSEL